MVTSYLAGSRLTTTKFPVESVRTDRCAPVPTFVTVIMADPTTAPEGSFTLPVNEPKVDCATTEAGVHNRNAAAKEARNHLLLEILNFEPITPIP
jgi:hypothetical protein